MFHNKYTYNISVLLIIIHSNLQFKKNIYFLIIFKVLYFLSGFWLKWFWSLAP